MKKLLNEILYFIHALFLSIFLMSGYEMIFHLSRPVDIAFGIIIMGYPLYVIGKDIKVMIDQVIDQVQSAYKDALEKHKHEIIEERNKKKV